MATNMEQRLEPAIVANERVAALALALKRALREEGAPWETETLARVLADEALAAGDKLEEACAKRAPARGGA